MKLIRNTEKENIYTYFPGIDYPNQWSFQNPAVYNHVKSENQTINLPKFIYLSQVHYLLFKVPGEIKYNISLINSSYVYGSYHIYFYDYLNVKLTDINKHINYLDYYIIGRDNDDLGIVDNFDISFEYPTYVLMVIMPCDEDSLSRNDSIKFSQPTMDFDYTSHYIIDWTNKVNGNNWSYTGKVNSFDNLYKAELINDKEQINEDELNEHLVFHALLQKKENNAKTGQRIYEAGSIQFDYKQSKQSAYFNGNSFIYTNEGQNIPKQNEQRTLMTWVLPLSGCIDRYIFSIGENSNGKRYGYGFNDYGRVGLYTYNNTSYYDFKWYYNHWYHMVFTYKNGVQKLYINGKFIQQTSRESLNTGNIGVAIGSAIGSYDSNFVGYISDVRIYNKQLNLQQIKLIYEGEQND